MRKRLTLACNKVMEKEFLLSTKECALILSALTKTHIPQAHIYYLIKTYELVGLQVGGQYRISEEELYDYYKRTLVRKPRYRRIHQQSSLFDECPGSSFHITDFLDDSLSPHLIQTIKRLQSRRLK